MRGYASPASKKQMASTCAEINNNHDYLAQLPIVRDKNA